MGSFSSDDESSELDRTHELTWALIDDRITDAEMGELEQLLLTETTARDSYIRCVQLHGDLASHFAPPQENPSAFGAKSTPILGFLNTGTPLTGLDSRTVDGAR